MKKTERRKQLSTKMTKKAVKMKEGRSYHAWRRRKLMAYGERNNRKGEMKTEENAINGEKCKEIEGISASSVLARRWRQTCAAGADIEENSEK
jgi:hypothetical protein